MRRPSGTRARGRVISSEGQRALLKSPLTFRTIAKELGVSPVTVGRWGSGKGVPSERYRKALRELCGIPEHAWYELNGRASRQAEREACEEERRGQGRRRAAEERAARRMEMLAQRQAEADKKRELRMVRQEIKEHRSTGKHAWVRHRGRIECVRCGMRAHWQGAGDPCGAISLGLKKEAEDMVKMRLRGVPDEVAERQAKVYVL